MRTRLTTHIIQNNMRHKRMQRIRRRIAFAKEEQANAPSELRLTKLGKIFPLIMIIAILLLLAMYAFSYGLLPQNLNPLVP